MADDEALRLLEEARISGCRSSRASCGRADPGERDGNYGTPWGYASIAYAVAVVLYAVLR